MNFNQPDLRLVFTVLFWNVLLIIYLHANSWLSKLRLNKLHADKNSVFQKGVADPDEMVRMRKVVYELDQVTKRRKLLRFGLILAYLGFVVYVGAAILLNMAAMNLIEVGSQFFVITYGGLALLLGSVVYLLLDLHALVTSG